MTIESECLKAPVNAKQRHRFNGLFKNCFDEQALQKSSAPLYKKIADVLGTLISSGKLKPGDKLPTHRSLADTLEVTVGTVTRAYAESERRGLVEARVGAGTFVRNCNTHGWYFPQVLPKQEMAQQAHNLEEARVHSDEIDFGFNYPPYFNRSDMFQQAMAALTGKPETLNSLLLYQPPEGFAEHRRVIAHWLNSHDIHLDADRLRFTSGAQNAMHMLFSAFCRGGDTILVEKLTYPGLINLARQQHLTLKPVEMDDEGLIPESLDNACRQYNPRFIYATPTLQNPTTVVMGEQRRKEIVEVCKRNDVYLIEDQVNGLQPLQNAEPLVNLAPEQVIYIGSLSKCLAPGLRVGFVQVPDSMLKRLTMAIQNQCWMVSPLLTGLSCKLIEMGAADQVLQFIRSEMQLRHSIVKEYLGEFGIQTRPGSFHGWLPLPDSWSLGAFVKACAKAGVNVKSGELFVPPGYAVPPAVRIAFSAPATREQMIAGIQTVRGILESDPEPVGML